MSYQLKAGENIGKGARRIARSQTTAGLHSLQTIELGSAEPEAILECRKRIKKVRGLLRLVRGSIGDDYRLADEHYRRGAQALAGLRDRQAQLEIFDRVVRTRGDLIPADGMLTVRAELVRRADLARASFAGDAGGPIEQAIEALVAAEAHIDRWTFSEEDWGGLSPGLLRTYRRGSAHLSRAEKSTNARSSNARSKKSKKSKKRATPRVLHDLRKQAKYTRFHLRILRRSAPSMLNPMADRFADLTSALGDARDLALLCDELLADRDAFGGDAATMATCRFAEELRTDLERRSLKLASLLYAERPEQLVVRLGAYWTVWTENGDEEPVGRVEVIGGAAAARSSDSKNVDELDELTMAQLRLLARSSDLPGRSRVQRDDLIAMLRASGVTGGGAAIGS